jgi:hypothetical protein
MTLREAIDEIGQRPAARLADVSGTALRHWYKTGQAPKWRQREAAKIIRAAEMKRLGNVQDKAA